MTAAKTYHSMSNRPTDTVFHKTTASRHNALTLRALNGPHCEGIFDNTVAAARSQHRRLDLIFYRSLIMTISSRILSISATVLALGIGGIVYAQATQGTHGRMGGGMGMQQGAGMHGGANGAMRGGMGGGMRGVGQPTDTATRLAANKAELKITADQEPAWQAFEAVVRQQADARQALSTGMQARMQDPAAAASFDRTAMRETMQKYRESEQAARDQALKALYAVLSPEQKLLADQRLSDGPGHGHRMGMGRFAG